MEIGELEEERRVKQFVPHKSFGAIIVNKKYDAVLKMEAKYLNEESQTEDDFENAAGAFMILPKNSKEY